MGLVFQKISFTRKKIREKKKVREEKTLPMKTFEKKHVTWTRNCRWELGKEGGRYMHLFTDEYDN